MDEISGYSKRNEIPGTDRLVPRCFSYKGRKDRLHTIDDFSRMMSSSNQELEKEMEYGGRMLSDSTMEQDRGDSLLRPAKSQDTISMGISMSTHIRIRLTSNPHPQRAFSYTAGRRLVNISCGDWIGQSQIIHIDDWSISSRPYA